MIMMSLVVAIDVAWSVTTMTSSVTSSRGSLRRGGFANRNFKSSNVLEHFLEAGIFLQSDPVLLRWHFQ
jgi:hypothetical protein